MPRSQNGGRSGRETQQCNTISSGYRRRAKLRIAATYSTVRADGRHGRPLLDDHAWQFLDGRKGGGRCHRRRDRPRKRGSTLGHGPWSPAASIAVPVIATEIVTTTGTVV
jgi:hypothetical protein